MWLATAWVHYTTSCNTQSSAPEDGQNNCPKHVELTGIINKPFLLNLVVCLFYLYQWCTVKQISDNEIYLLFKYIKNVLWRVAKRLSYIEDARCLKVIQNTLRYHVLQWRGRVFIQRCHHRCLVSLKASIFQSLGVYTAFWGWFRRVDCSVHGDQRIRVEVLTTMTISKRF